MVIVVPSLLLADAELGEDMREELVREEGAAAGDRGEGGGDGADLLAQQVGWELRRQPLASPLQGLAGFRQRLVVAGRGDDRSPLFERLRRYGGTQRPPQRIDSLAAAGRHRKDFICRAFRRIRKSACDRSLVRFRFKSCRPGQPVDLVEHRQQPLPGAERQLEGRNGAAVQRRRIDHPHDDLRPLDGAHRPLDPHPFEAVLRMADPRRVEDAERDPVDRQPLLDYIARRAGDFRDHRPLLLQQLVEQRRFSDIRRPNDRYGDPLLEGVAEGERAAQPLRLGVDLLQQRRELAAVGEIDLLLAEVELQFEQGREVHQPLAQPVERRRVAAAQLVRRQRMGGPGGGGDQIGHRLGLCQIEFPVEVGAAREFARPGHAGPGLQCQAQHLADDVGGAVARKFDRLFARVGVRRPEEGRHRLVHDAFAVTDRAETAAPARPLGEGPAAAEEPVGDRHGLGAGEADHGQSAARGRSRGDDRIAVGVHGVISRCAAAVRCGCGRFSARSSASAA